MTATSAPFGLRPVSHPSGTIRQEQLVSGIASGYASALYTGTPVKFLTDGTLGAVATGADVAIGVFQGCEFSSATKYFVLPYWPASQTYDSSNPMYAFYTSDKEITYEAQCDGAVAQTALGEAINLVDASSVGSTYTGQSQQQLNHTTTGATPGTFVITNLAPYDNNAWGDAFTVVRVRISSYQGPIA